MVVVVASDHPLAGAATITRDQLYSLTFVSLHRSSTLQGIRTQLQAADICWTGLRVDMVRRWAAAACSIRRPSGSWHPLAGLGCAPPGSHPRVVGPRRSPVAAGRQWLRARGGEARRRSIRWRP